MPNLKGKLIKLGSENPDLQKHLEPVLDVLTGEREASYGLDSLQDIGGNLLELAREVDGLMDQGLPKNIKNNLTKTAERLRSLAERSKRSDNWRSIAEDDLNTLIFKSLNQSVKSARERGLRDTKRRLEKIREDFKDVQEVLGEETLERM